MAIITCGIRTLDTAIIRDVFRTKHTSIISLATVRRFRQNRHFQRASLPSYLNFCYDAGKCLPYSPFSPNMPFSLKSPLSKGPFAIEIFTNPVAISFFARSAIFAIACISGHFFPRTALRRRRHYGISLKHM